MKTITTSIKTVMISIIFDILAVSVIFLLPTVSHLIAFPLYLLDPMRIALIVSIVYTNRKNAYLIAFLLPIVSFITSSHPLFYKVLIISAELIINVWLFYFLVNRIGNLFISALASIILSKAIYYLAKFVVIYFAFEKVELIATPLYIQGIAALVLSVFVAIFLKQEEENS